MRDGTPDSRLPSTSREDRQEALILEADECTFGLRDGWRDPRGGMRMQKKLYLKVVLLSVLAGAACLVQAMAQSPQSRSLGELARKFREEKAKSGTKPVKVYTNDNIP